MVVEGVEELLVEKEEGPCLTLEVEVEVEEVAVVERGKAALKLTAEETECLREGRSHCSCLRSPFHLLLQRHRKPF